MNNINNKNVHEEQTFVTEIRENPDDESARSVYSDWLEEHGDPRAEYLRLEQRLETMKDSDPQYRKLKSRFRKLHKQIDKAWLMELSRSRIENCDYDQLPKFEFQCPKQWDKLQSTEDPTVRMCDQCHRPVFYCGSIKEASELAWADQCVAIDPDVNRKEHDLPNSRAVLGMFAEPEIPKRLKEFNTAQQKDSPRVDQTGSS